MIKNPSRAVFFLALIFITLVLSLARPVNLFAAGDEEPTATPTPEEVAEEAIESETKGGEEITGQTPIYGGEPVYGGGVVSPKEGDFLVDKTVKNPATGDFVDHLGPTDPKYRPLDIVVFQIKVNNPNTEDISAIEAVDTLPDFVDFMTGPGSFDQDSRKLTFNVEDLKAGETREFEIKARVSHQSAFPEEKSVFCPVNIIEATLGEQTDRDESQFCIEKEMPAPQVPEAGAEQIILALLGTALSAGLILRKKSFI